MDRASPELPSELNLAGLFGTPAEAFAREVAAALNRPMMGTEEQAYPSDWDMDPRVMSAVMALTEDR